VIESDVGGVDSTTGTEGVEGNGSGENASVVEGVEGIGEGGAIEFEVG